MIKKIQFVYKNKIRIISGKWKGYKLTILNNNNLRPTTNKMRETLFNWLMPVIQGAKCLDCFAGSGALSIEALSRNASLATLIELEPLTIMQLTNNLLKLGIKNIEIINNNVLNYLTQQVTITYDIIFLDPPFRKNLLQQTILLLEQNGWLTKKCWIYIEAEVEAINNLTILPTNWILYRKKITNNAIYCLYIRYK
ncbi:MAG: 16S rRNA (guanine(966)-N(2))-methyltransferase [Arsenophonus endosymbiont of Ceratovacuna japonica]